MQRPAVLQDESLWADRRLRDRVPLFPKGGFQLLTRTAKRVRSQRQRWNGEGASAELFSQFKPPLINPASRQPVGAGVRDGQPLNRVVSDIGPRDVASSIQIPKNPVDQPSPISAFHLFGERDGFIHGRGHRDTIQIQHLVGPKTEHVGHDKRESLHRTTGDRVQPPIQRGPVPEDPIHQFKRQGLVLGWQLRGRGESGKRLIRKATVAFHGPKRLKGQPPRRSGSI